MLNESEGAGDSPELAIGYSSLAPVSGIVSLHSLARAYRQRALVVAAKANDPYATARVLQNTGLYNLGIGNWDDALQALDESAAIFNKLGYSRRADESMGLGGNINFYRGQFEASAERYFIAIANARQRSDKHLEMLSLSAAGQNLVRLLYMGQPEQADEIAAKTIDIVRTAPIAVVYRCASYWEIVQVYMELSEHSGTETPERQAYLKQQVAYACQGLHKFSRVFPIGLPRELMYSGTRSWLDGEKDKAYQTWKKSLDEAIQRKMPYDQGMIHFEIGRHLEAGDPTRKVHLDRALEIFGELKAGADLARVRALQ